MIINYLDKHLPVEITDIIYKMFHRSCMRDICNTIQYKVVFILTENEKTNEKNKISFLVCEGSNYYYLLGDEIVLGT